MQRFIADASIEANSRCDGSRESQARSGTLSKVSTRRSVRRLCALRRRLAEISPEAVWGYLPGMRLQKTPALQSCAGANVIA